MTWAAFIGETEPISVHVNLSVTIVFTEFLYPVVDSDQNFIHTGLL